MVASNAYCMGMSMEDNDMGEASNAYLWGCLWETMIWVRPLMFTVW